MNEEKIKDTVEINDAPKPRQDLITKLLPLSKARHPEYLVCEHGCEEVVQIKVESLDVVVFEFCYIDAKHFAVNLAKQITKIEQDKNYPKEN